VATETLRSLDDATRAAVVEFLRANAVATGREPLSDQLWADLTGAPARGFAAVIVRSGGDIIAYGQVSRVPGSALAEIVTSVRTADTGLDTSLETVLEALISAARSDGGGRFEWWVHDVLTGDTNIDFHTIASRYGLDTRRALLEMRCPLPLDPHIVDGHVLDVHGFRRGVDEQRWLDVNALAFAGHPEQGDWTQETLAARTRQPWFREDDLLLLEAPGDGEALDRPLAGFCWTKRHDDPTGTLGEIYVIGVDPAMHGRGLGRALVITGLDHLAAVGATTAMLFVDEDNAAALALYRSLGFTEHARSVAHTGLLVSDGSPAGAI
jgi:mycothiol synthase